jgi:hypothetical protein
MGNFIDEYEKAGYFDDEDNKEMDDDWERYEDERIDPNTTQAKHAKSLVGKWCKGKNTPIYGDILVKVLSVSEYDLGCVKTITFKSSKSLFQVGHWNVVGGGGLPETIGSMWLELTNKRPNLLDWAIMPLAVITRVIVHEFEHERKCFQYKWWKDGDILYHQYNPIFANLVSAFYDFGRAFKYGVMLPRH